MRSKCAHLAAQPAQRLDDILAADASDLDRALGLLERRVDALEQQSAPFLRVAIAHESGARTAAPGLTTVKVSEGGSARAETAKADHVFRRGCGWKRVA